MSSLFPYFLSFSAVFCYALIGPIAKKVGADLPPFTFIAVSTLTLCVPAAVIGYFLERDKVASAFNVIHWNWLFALSIINLAGFVLYLMAIKKVPIAQHDMFGILMPVIGGLFAVFLLNEPFHPRYIVAIAFMAAGLAIAVYPDLKIK